MMKIKFLSCLLALTMSFSCVSAFAENTDGNETAAENEAVETVVEEETEDISVSKEEVELPEEKAENPIMKEFYVSVNGNDTGNGTKNSPFKTIERAKEEVRKYNSDMSGDIVIHIAAGTYYSENTINFGLEDSATNGFLIRFEGDGDTNTVLSGGRKITDWQLYDKNANIYVANAAGIDSRQLFVNGERRWRASTTDIKLETGSGRDEYFDPERALESIKNVTNVEMVFQKSFSDVHIPITKYKDGVVTGCETMQSYGHQGSLLRLENAYEWLDQEGEWYLNKSQGKVYYKPYENENMDEADVVLPVCETLIKVEGEIDKYVYGISFKNLAIKHTTWLGPNDPKYGYLNFQSGFCREFDKYYGDNDYYNVDPAFLVNFSDGVYIERCTFENIGGAAVWFRNGAHNCSVIGCEITDVSHNGVMAGHSFHHGYTPSLKKYSDNIRIENNVCHNIGIEYWGCIPITGFYVGKTSILHNEIYDAPYTGISFGWGWFATWPQTAAASGVEVSEIKDYDYSTWTNRDNIIGYNLIHDCMTILEDGGGIYTIGASPNSKVVGNRIYDISRKGVNATGLYHDNGSRFWEIYDNAISDATKAHTIAGADNYSHNNYFDTNYLDTQYVDQRNQVGEAKSSGRLPNPEEHYNVQENETVVTDGYYPEFITSDAGLEYEFQRGIEGNENENLINKNNTLTVFKTDGSRGNTAMGKGIAAAMDGKLTTATSALGIDTWSALLTMENRRKLDTLRVAFSDSTTLQNIKISVSPNGKDFTDITPSEVLKDNVIDLKGKYIVKNIKIENTAGKMEIAELEAYAKDFKKEISDADKIANLELVTFDDIAEHWAKSDIEYLATLGIIKGISKEEFKPEGNISRAEWITLITRAAGVQMTPYLGSISDVSSGKWYADYIQGAYNKGYLELLIENGALNPEKAITRQEAAYIISKCGIEADEQIEVEFSDMAEADDKFAESIKFTARNGFITGVSENTFAPGKYLTRAEAATIIKRLADA